MTVTGGPQTGGAETQWSYTITFVNGLGGYELEEAVIAEEAVLSEKEEEAQEKEEEKITKAGGVVEEGEAEVNEVTMGGRDTVEYMLTPVNTGATATSGTITLTDALPRT